MTDTTALSARRPSRSARRLDRGDLDQTLGFILRRALVQREQRFVEVMGEANVTAGLYAMLAVIDLNPGCRISDLAASIGIGPNNMVPMIDVLLSRGLVVRTLSDHDRRAKRLSLTGAGQTYVAELRRRHQVITDEVQARMGPENLDRLVSLLWELTGDKDA